MADRFIRLPEVEHRVGLKKSAIYTRIREGSFPAPRKLAINCAVWLESAVDAWLKAQLGDPEPSGTPG